MDSTGRYFSKPNLEVFERLADETPETNKKAKRKRNFPSKIKKDPYPGQAPIDPEKIAKYEPGEELLTEGLKTKYAQKKFAQKWKKVKESAVQAARSELLLHEEPGFLEAEDGEFSDLISQREIVEAVDISTATKHFELDLPKFGPYRLSYTRNGRHLLLGGKMGHVAALDWQTKRLHCETNVMETVRDVQWLHIETMFAVAQKKWTFIYDSQGVELHCLKSLNEVLRLEFLPYHFLLVGSSATSFLHWLDVSVGKMVKSFPIREGRLDVMCQSPANAVILCGHPKGTVSMWSPNVQEPLVKMLCHKAPVRGLAVDHTGHYMATAGLDRQVRIWDLRQYKQLNAFQLRTAGVGSLAFSQKRLLACAIGNSAQVFKDVCSTTQVQSAYLAHKSRHTITDLSFCPFEDVLGIGHQAGFLSLLVPGAGEPNIDGLEANPYLSTKQRKEQEVKALLDKVQPEMISLEPGLISEVDRRGLMDVQEEKAKILYVKKEPIQIRLKHKMKGKASATRKEKRKQGLKEAVRKERIQQEKSVREELFGKTPAKQEPQSVLDRFKRND